MAFFPWSVPPSPTLQEVEPVYFAEIRERRDPLADGPCACCGHPCGFVAWPVNLADELHPEPLCLYCRPGALASIREQGFGHRDWSMHRLVPAGLCSPQEGA